jgi:hypothetical protein
MHKKLSIGSGLHRARRNRSRGPRVSRPKTKPAASPVREALFLSFEEFKQVPDWAKEHIATWEPEMVRYAFLNGTLSVNLNRIVRVGLTARGQQILASLPMHEQEAVSHRYNNCLGELEIELWRFCAIFGPHFCQGKDVPTEQNAIVLQPDLSVLRQAPKPLRARVNKSGRVRA